VFNLIYLRSTLRQDGREYILPTIDDRLSEEVTEAYRARPDDRTSPLSSSVDLERFLQEHRGWKLTTWDVASMRRAHWTYSDSSERS
jgi:hypothetical protein